MLKAGLIGAAVGCVLAIVGGVVFPALCNPCAALFVGLGAGVLAGVFGQPKDRASSAGEGAKAGGIATVGNLVGQMVGTAVVGASVDPALVAQATAETSRRFGLAVIDPELYVQIYTPMLIVSNLLCGVAGIVLGAGLGAVGGLLWRQLRQQGDEISSSVLDG